MSSYDATSNLTLQQGELFESPQTWRDITPRMVREVLEGSILDSLCTAFSKFYTPEAPLPLVLMQALVLTGTALTHRYGKTAMAATGSLSPAQLSDVYIDTMNGNVPNVFAMIVAPSGAGKGQIPIQLFSATGYRIFNNASLEGVKDYAMDNPHILLSIQELGKYLSGHGYKDDFKSNLTNMFNEGYFYDAQSQTKRSTQRKSDWFYPSVYAAIQPTVLQSMGCGLDLTQGFFPRFLYGYIDESEMNYDIRPCNPDRDRDMENLWNRLHEISQLSGIVSVPVETYNRDFLAPIAPSLAENMKSLAMRYANEYLPRIALMLALPGVGSALPTDRIPELTEEHLFRAGIVLQYILHMAERALEGLNDLKGRLKQNEDNMRKMVKIIHRIEVKHPGESATLPIISRNSNGTGWNGKERTQTLLELVNRGWCRLLQNGRDITNAISEHRVLPRGCSFKIDVARLPPGAL